MPELKLVTSTPPITGTLTMKMIDAAKRMCEHRVRSLVLVERGGRYAGMLLVDHILSLLGGGELYDVVVGVLGSDLYSTVNIAVSEIADLDYPYLRLDASIDEVLRTLIEKDLSIIPILRKKSEAVYGVVSEHDLVRPLAGSVIGIKVSEVISPLMTLEESAPLIEAVRKMTRTRLRRIFLADASGNITSILEADAVCCYISSRAAFRETKKGYIEELLMIESARLASSSRIRTVDPREDVGAAISKIIEDNVGALLVIENSKAVGAITARDALYALLS